MDFLEKLNYLMDKNKLNKSTLSKACDIPYTTIDGWYKKGYEGLKLTTLRKLANFFETPLDFWVEDEPVTIPNKFLLNDDIPVEQTKKTTLENEGGFDLPERQALINAVREMDEETARAVLDVVNSVLKLRGE